MLHKQNCRALTVKTAETVISARRSISAVFLSFVLISSVLPTWSQTSNTVLWLMLAIIPTHFSFSFGDRSAFPFCDCEQKAGFLFPCSPHCLPIGKSTADRCLSPTLLHPNAPSTSSQCCSAQHQPTLLAQGNPLQKPQPTAAQSTHLSTYSTSQSLRGQIKWGPHISSCILSSS